MIIAIPTDDKATVASVFGRARYFALYRDGSKTPEFIEGTSNAEHGAGTGAVSRLAELGVSGVLSADIGPKARSALETAKITAKIVQAGSPLAQIIDHA